MIDKLTYEEILQISKDLKIQAEIIDSLLEGKDAPELRDFAATVEGYSKYLENTVDINKQADKALDDLKRRLGKK